MKKILLIISLLFPLISYSTISIETGTNLTFHYAPDNGSDYYKNNFGTRLVYNNFFKLNIRNEQKNHSIFKSTDCLGQDTYGYLYTHNLKQIGNLNIGYGVGFYTIKTQLWDKLDFEKYWLSINENRGLVLLLGANFSYIIYQKDQINFKFNSLITPLGMTLTGLSLEVPF
jgi:hypothetical protein